jgi:hypothetical protein
MNPPSRSMPPPPAIGAVRTPKAPTSPTEGASGDGALPSDDSATGRWPALGVQIAGDDGPSDEAGSRSLPIATAQPRVAPAPTLTPAKRAGGQRVPLGPSESSGLRVPVLDASSSTSGLRAPSLDASAADAASESAASWPKTDGWDLDEDAHASAGAGSVPSVPKPAATSSVPSVPKPAATSSVPSVPKPAATHGAAMPKVGSVPKGGPLPKPGSVPKVAPTPKLGVTPKATPAPTPSEGATASTTAADDAALADRSHAPPAPSAAPLFDVAPSLHATPSPDAASVLDAALAQSASPSFDAAPLAAATSPSPSPAWSELPPLAAPSPDASGPDGLPLLDSTSLLGQELTEPSPSVPRLPLPGMMRDGPAPKAADFRATPRPPRSQTAAAMQPPRGMVPPKLRDDEEPRLKPGDTASFVAQVAVELMQEAERREAAGQEPPAAASTADLRVEPKVAAEPAMISMTRAPIPPWTGPEDHPAAYGSAQVQGKRRGVILGVVGVAAAIGLMAWLWSSRGQEPPPQTAAATPAVVEPTTPELPRVADGEAIAPEAPPVAPPVAAADQAGSTGGAVEAAASDDTGAGSGEPAPDGSTGPQGEPDPMETAGEPQAVSGAAPRKASNKGKSSPKPSDKPAAAPKPAEAPKPDAPSASQLLKQARSAYQAGKGSSAYGLASKSNRMTPSGEAAEVMALAACLMKDADKAKSALKNVPLLRRGSVRTACKNKHDVRVGL